MTKMAHFMPHDIVVAAINAATLAAIQKARQTNTMMVVCDDYGHIVEITPDEAEAQFYASMPKDTAK